jgi:hypothetical protein
MRHCDIHGHVYDTSTMRARPRFRVRASGSRLSPGRQANGPDRWGSPGRSMITKGAY